MWVCKISSRGVRTIHLGRGVCLVHGLSFPHTSEPCWRLELWKWLFKPVGLLSSKLGCALAFGLEEADPAKSHSEPHILYFSGVVIRSCTQCGFSLCTFSPERECYYGLLNQWKEPVGASQFCHKSSFVPLPLPPPHQPWYNSSGCCVKLHLICAAVSRYSSWYSFHLQRKVLI